MSMEAGACSCDGYDYEPLSVCNVKEVKARKEHTCDECHETIKKGQSYYRWSALFEGSWSNGKRCLPCWRIGVDYFCGILGCGTVWEYCWERLGVDLRTGKTREETPFRHLRPQTEAKE